MSLTLRLRPAPGRRMRDLPLLLSRAPRHCPSMAASFRWDLQTVTDSRESRINNYIHLNNASAELLRRVARAPGGCAAVISIEAKRKKVERKKRNRVPRARPAGGREPRGRPRPEMAVDCRCVCGKLACRRAGRRRARRGRAAAGGWRRLIADATRGRRGGARRSHRRRAGGRLWVFTVVLLVVAGARGQGLRSTPARAVSRRLWREEVQGPSPWLYAACRPCLRAGPRVPPQL